MQIGPGNQQVDKTIIVDRESHGSTERDGGFELLDLVRT
jgi:hypothetical protein